MSTLSDRLRGYAQKHDPIVWSTDIMSPRQKAELEAADELDRLTARVAELEAAASAALKHADSNGMQGWSVFNRLRAAMENKHG